MKNRDMIEILQRADLDAETAILTSNGRIVTLSVRHLGYVDGYGKRFTILEMDEKFPTQKPEQPPKKTIRT